MYSQVWMGDNLEMYFNLLIRFHKSVLEVPFWDRPWILEFRPSHSAAVHGPEQINADDYLREAHGNKTLVLYNEPEGRVLRAL